MESNKMINDYSFLRGKIKEVCKSQDVYAKMLGISNTALSNKLNNQNNFTTDQIYKSREILSLNDTELVKAFFSTVEM